MEGENEDLKRGMIPRTVDHIFKSLKELETDQVNASVSISKNETVLKNVQDALEKHLEIVARNIKAFDDRLGAIKK